MNYIGGILEILNRRESSPIECFRAILIFDSSKNLMPSEPGYEPMTEEGRRVRRILADGNHLTRCGIPIKEWEDLIPTIINAIRVQITASLDSAKKGKPVPEAENVWKVITKRKNELANSGRFPPEVVEDWYDIGNL